MEFMLFLFKSKSINSIHTLTVTICFLYNINKSKMHIQLITSLLVHKCIGGIFINTRKLTISAMLVAIGVTTSHLIFIPIGAAKCFPMQHTINVLSAVMLGPWYGVANAFLISLIRNILGTGSLLAFPGSMIGALFAGLLFKKFSNRIYAVLGEIIGTGLIGGLLAFPIAKLLMGKEIGALFFVTPFLFSTLAGSLIAAAMISVPRVMSLTKALNKGVQ